MNISTTPLSPQALLAGIAAVADTIGPNCRTRMINEMVRVQRLASPADTTDSVLRDRFAADAMAAIIGNDRVLKGVSDTGEMKGVGLGESVAAAAYEFADAMLAARGPA